MCDWAVNFLSEGGSESCVIMAFLMFRHFNRVSTWSCIVRAFAPHLGKPNFDLLESELRDCGGKLHKAHSIPVAVRDDQGLYVGRDAVENAMFTFRHVWENHAFKAMCEALACGIRTTEEYAEVLQLWSHLRKMYPGAFGTYRQKNNMDLWVAVGALSREAINFWPVASGSGTWKSLAYLYGTKIQSEDHASDLLRDLYHKVRQCGSFSTRADTIATVALNLCGWHRTSYTCSLRGCTVTGLDRAIDDEERAVLRLRELLREESD